MTRWTLTLAALALFAAGGCMKIEQELTLNADGSADMKLRYGMTEQAIAQLEGMKKMAEKDPNMKVESKGPDLVFDKAKIEADFKAKAAEGVELKSCNVETKEGWKFAVLEVHCRDLAAATKAGQAAGTEGGFSLTKNADGNYVLDMGGAKGLGGDEAGDKQDPKMKAQQQQMMKTMMAGLRVAIKVNVPGDVVETTAPEKDKRSASWVLDIGDDKFFEKGEEMNKKGAKVTFSGKGLNLTEVKPAAKKEGEPK